MATPPTRVPLRFQTLKLNTDAPVTKYRGIDCDVGRVRIWLPDPVTLTRHGPLTLIAKFPRAPLTSPDQAVVLLGLNFFDENVAGVRFRYRRIGNKGWIDLA